MKAFILKRRLHWSSYLVLIFGTMIFIAAVFAELFQSTPMEPQEINQLIKNPIPFESLNKMEKFTLSNKQGTFVLQNNHPELLVEGPWTMESPQKAKIKPSMMLKMLRSLESLHVRSLHYQEPINNASFSIDNPTSVLTWSHPIYGELILKFGLVNPIDNSLYFTLSREKWIYQSTLPTDTFEAVALNDLIDTEMIYIQTNTILRAEISKAPFGEPVFAIEKINDKWQKRDGTIIADQKITQCFERFEKIKSYMILDKLNSEDVSQLEKLQQNPLFKLSLTYPDRLENYFISPLIQKLGNIALGKGNSFLFYLEDSPAPLVVSENFFNVFQISDKDI
jgi:hypothetical protein